MVTVEANGKQELTAIKIDREVINPEDSQMLEDLVLAACNEALRKSKGADAGRARQALRRAEDPGLGLDPWPITPSRWRA